MVRFVLKRGPFCPERGPFCPNHGPFFPWSVLSVVRFVPNSCNSPVQVRLRVIQITAAVMRKISKATRMLVFQLPVS